MIETGYGSEIATVGLDGDTSMMAQPAKTATRVIVVLLTLVVAACGKLNTRIDETIEEVGTDLTDVPVEVEKVKIRFGAVSGEIAGLTIANPDGYQTINAFDMDQLRLNVALLKTLGTPLIVLDELLIDSPVLILEFNEEGGSNLKEIADNVKRNVERAQSGAGAAPGPAAEPAGDKDSNPIRISLRRLVIEGVSFYVRRTDGTFRSGTLPTIELTDVGGEEGASPAGLGAVVVLAMAGEMLKQAVAHKLAEGFRFEPEKLLSYLEQRLSLSEDQLSAVRPVTVTLTETLNDVLEPWSTEGFVDVESLAGELGAVAEEARSALAQVLDGEQLEEFNAFLDNLDQEALEAVRDAQVEGLADALGLREDQLPKLKPILRQHIEKLGTLLQAVVSSPDRTVENFSAEYDALRKETRGKLARVLDEAQLQILAARQEEVRERIRGLLF